MYIKSVSHVNFNARISNQLPPKSFRFRVPGKNNTTVVSTVYSDYQDHIKILDYEVKRKNKIVDHGSFQNKKGFNEESLVNICEIMQDCVKDGIDYVTEFFNALYIKNL